MATITGITTSNESLNGTSSNDVLVGGAGENTLHGGAGKDVFAASIRLPFFDTVYTIQSYDIVADFVQGTDRIDLSSYGISSFDQLKAILEPSPSNANDAYFNAYFGGIDHEWLIKGVTFAQLKASDFIYSTASGSIIQGTETWGGHDRLFGSTGNDTIEGYGGDDQLLGGNGDDVLVGGAGQNTLHGGAGRDVFAASIRLPFFDTVYTIQSYDIVADFVQGTDRIDLSSYGISSFDQLKAILEPSPSNANDAYFNAYFGGIDHEWLIKGVTFAQLKASDFIYSTASGSIIQGTETWGGHDRLFGSTGNDTIEGYGGDDQLLGGNGDDVLVGGAGQNTLHGGAGRDTMIGGYGDDIYFVTDSGDIIDESTGDGIDEVQSTISFSISNSSKVLGEIENLTLLGSATINGTGNSLVNVITGNTGNNILDGKAGADTLVGGKGNDTYIVDNKGDKVVETVNEGTDLVRASVSYTLATNVENLTLTGSAAVNGTGNSTANVIIGNTGNNVLDGKAGADTLSGGKGNDTYIIDNKGDKVVETVNEGTDLVRASVSYTLATNVENLTLTGSAAVNGTGNSTANVIIGNTGNNVLDGKAGADTLSGGKGNDTYIIDNKGDKVVETVNEGTDLVRASVSYTLATNVENLTLTGSAAVNGTGNSTANVIIGNAGNNILDGKAGADTLSGGKGNDILTGGLGKDTFLFNKALNASKNVDRITDFSAKDDTIYLENAVFKALTTTGKLASSAFVTNSDGTAMDAKDRIVYETDTGKLFYDADGSGDGAAVHFATLNGKPAISAADFFVL
ncbi:hypothetical protein MUO32_19205 [Shinella sp. CPCC 101442]|uniref:beta strand repeat-containing protein n=1 Tax=Shinella sp. CPCC 101442 TaxID=2932265 RepID=UPI002152E322|nr:calcium-binding protein [Shinella sp. CPCC 101442]MCR6501168.1 hypothetical protein [Shinella sp. CPCC 101442]